MKDIKSLEGQQLRKDKAYVGSETDERYKVYVGQTLMKDIKSM
jgi:hypothetical protein